MHYVHYREPSGKEPNAPLSLDGASGRGGIGLKNPMSL